jgi:hypothetical protein
LDVSAAATVGQTKHTVVVILNGEGGQFLIWTNANPSRIIGIARVVTTRPDSAAEFFPLQFSALIPAKSPIHRAQHCAATTSVVRQSVPTSSFFLFLIKPPGTMEANRPEVRIFLDTPTPFHFKR